MDVHGCLVVQSTDRQLAGRQGHEVRLDVPRAKSFNWPLNDWRVDNVTKMYGMFLCADAFNQPLNDWRVDNVTIMGSISLQDHVQLVPLGRLAT